jgi:predicted permease
MPLLPRLRSLMASWFSRDRVEKDLDEELGAVVDQLAAEKIAAGMSADDAAREARLEVGGVEQVKEEVRAVRAGAALETFGRDLRLGLRGLARAPGLSAAVIAILGLGIGVNSALFSLIDAFLYRPLPAVSHPEELVYLRSSLSYPTFLDIQAGNDVFTAMAAFAGKERYVIGGAGAPEIVTGELVSADAFTVLGVEPARGRTFVAADDRPAAAPVAVISDALWRRHPELLEHGVRVNGLEVRVVGVAPPGFIGSEAGLPRDLWMPLALAERFGGPGEGDRLLSRDVEWLTVVARLASGVSVERAQATTVGLAARIAADHGGGEVDRLSRAAMLLPVIGGLDPRDRLDATTAAVFLMVLVGIVLVVACANVAGLVLARALARIKEMGIRRALGATRMRLVRQLLTESLVLALLGGAAGLVLAGLAADLVAAIARGTPLVLPELEVDGRVLAFTFALSLATAVLFGLAPAIQASRADVMAALREEVPASRPSRLRRVLVVGQVALSLLFLIGAGLFGRSLLGARGVDPGFVVERGLTLPIEPRLARWSAPEAQAFYRRLLPEIEALPEVESASLVNLVPLGLSVAETIVQGGGAGETELRAGLNVVGPGYFRAMGIPLVRGRDVAPTDDSSASPVAVINESLARRLFPDGAAVGRSLRAAGLRQVIGVVADSKTRSFGEHDRPAVYLPVAQDFRGSMTLIARVRPGAGDADAAIRRRVSALAPDLPLGETRTLAQHVDLAVLPARVLGTLLAAFGFLALTLAVVGLYGLVATSVRQRRHEIGVRMALGASGADVLRLVLRDGTAVAGVGIAAGLALAVGLTRFLEALLYGVSATDPVTFAVIPVLLLGVAALASWLPARKATRVDPMVALRAE